MAKYKSDHADILFNLLDVLNVTQYEQYGFDEASVKEILNEYDKFVENEVFPTRAESDEEGAKWTKEGVKAPQCLHKVNKSFYEMGWYALGLPEEVEGTPVPEALSAACRSLSTGANTAWSMYPALSKGAMNVLRMVGDDYCKSYIPKMMSGEWGGTMCLTEPGAGSDVGAAKTTAKPIDGKKGWYSIKGTKIFISSGESDLYANNIHLVLARTPGADEGTKGISLFLVPRFKVNDDMSLGDSNDVVCTSIEHKMGIHASSTCVMNFGDIDNCEGYLIGKEFDGMKNMFIMMNEARLDCGIQGEAQANLAYEMTLQYVKERSQFKAEIINHPDVRKMMLKMRAMSRGMRSLILYSADLFDKAHKDEKYESLVALMTPICKSFCSEQGFNVSVEAVQAHGGYGYCTEYGVEQFVRDTKIATIYEGTNGIQAIDLVMRKILKDGGQALGIISKQIVETVNSLSDDLSGEKDLFNKVLASAQSAMEFMGAKAKAKEMNHVLQGCSDFLNLQGHILIAWRLAIGANIAKSKLASASNEEEKTFLESKIVDFKIYCSQYLVHAQALSKSITLQAEDITSFDI